MYSKAGLGESGLLWVNSPEVNVPPGTMRGFLSRAKRDRQTICSESFIWVLPLDCEGCCMQGSALQLWLWQEPCSQHAGALRPFLHSSCSAQHRWLLDVVLHRGSNTSSSSPGTAR